jgi:HK97 family phage major capsid protein
MRNTQRDLAALRRIYEAEWDRRNAALDASGVAQNRVDPNVEDANADTNGNQPPRFRTVDEYEARQTSIREELTSLDEQWVGQIMPDEQTRRWNELNEELEENARVIAHIQTRQARLMELRDNPTAIENGGSLGVRAAASRRGPSDIYDVWAVRQHARGPEDETRMLRDNAMRAVEGAYFPHPSADQDAVRGHIERLMNRFESIDESSTFGVREGNLTEFARRILLTGSPLYLRAFGKQVMGRPLSPEEQRALSTTTTAGGFAVPFALDPTIIPTGNSSINPYRAICRVETIAVSTWQGVSAGDITATRRSEGAQTSDAAPTLAQPTATPSRVDAFVPYSIEIGQDWGSLQMEMARLIQRAKDNEEATSFSTGNGVAPNPQGVLSGATTVVTGATSGVLAVGDVYATYNALPPGFKPEAQWVANEALWNRIRQFDTAGGASIFIENLQLGTGGTGVPTPGNMAARMLGRGANECSAYPSTIANADRVLTIGDWSYFVIVDRVGMDVELIPHLFGTSQLPTGQRGLFAYWRNSSTVVSANAFRTLRIL